jgi:hypothetical protein
LAAVSIATGADSIVIFLYGSTEGRERERRIVGRFG